MRQSRDEEARKRERRCIRRGFWSQAKAFDFVKGNPFDPLTDEPLHVFAVEHTPLDPSSHFVISPSQNPFFFSLSEDVNDEDDGGEDEDRDIDGDDQRGDDHSRKDDRGGRSDRGCGEEEKEIRPRRFFLVISFSELWRKYWKEGRFQYKAGHQDDQNDIESQRRGLDRASTIAINDDQMLGRKREKERGIKRERDVVDFFCRFVPSHLHFYEVIPEGRPCLLYFDIEYDKDGSFLFAEPTAGDDHSNYQSNH